MGTLKDLDVYKLAYQSALSINELTESFPGFEKFSLTDQLRRSTRSVVANIAEAYRKRSYPKHFKSKLSDADSELCETLMWLDFAKDFGYLPIEHHAQLCSAYERIGAMIGKMIRNPHKFQ